MTATTEALIHTEARVQYAICDSCAPRLAHGDADSLNTWNEEAEEVELHPLAMFAEEAGAVTLWGVLDRGGCWDCEACREVTVGAGYVFEGERPTA